MKEEWVRQQLSTTTPHKSSVWQYTTNNDGSSLTKNNNAKTRNLELIRQRNFSAHYMYQRGIFSYSKWEVVPQHSLVQEMEQSFTSRAMRERVESLFNQHTSGVSSYNLTLQPQLSDLFVTLYGTGDFLSPHDDGVAGSVAFVISLMDGPFTTIDARDDSTGGNPILNEEWQDDFGGHTRYECPYHPSEHRTRQVQRQEAQKMSKPYAYNWCESNAPAFNTALLFRTRPVGALHEVMPVSYKAEERGFYRFGLTGWYIAEDDTMDEHAKAERDKMRARD
jgi:Rps23 Pro-64 3,4-dihydroxylase Tpa1-like proline 4-hydroxylase